IPQVGVNRAVVDWAAAFLVLPLPTYTDDARLAAPEFLSPLFQGVQNAKINTIAVVLGGRNAGHDSHADGPLDPAGSTLVTRSRRSRAGGRQGLVCQRCGSDPRSKVHAVPRNCRANGESEPAHPRWRAQGRPPWACDRAWRRSNQSPI